MNLMGCATPILYGSIRGDIMAYPVVVHHLFKKYMEKKAREDAESTEEDNVCETA